MLRIQKTKVIHLCHVHRILRSVHPPREAVVCGYALQIFLFGFTTVVLRGQYVRLLRHIDNG